MKSTDNSGNSHNMRVNPSYCVSCRNSAASETSTRQKAPRQSAKTPPSKKESANRDLLLTACSIRRSLSHGNMSNAANRYRKHQEQVSMLPSAKADLPASFLKNSPSFSNEYTGEISTSQWSYNAPPSKSRNSAASETSTRQKAPRQSAKTPPSTNFPDCWIWAICSPMTRRRLVMSSALKMVSKAFTVTKNRIVKPLFNKI